MSRKRHIVAIDPDSQDPTPAVESASESQGYAGEEAMDDETFDEPQPIRRVGDWLLPALAIAALLGWTAFFVWVHQREMLAGAPPARWSEWITGWAAPALLVLALWLIALRSSRREALRSAEAARALSLESALLEERLVRVNRELSMAREFIASESRDLEALGRMAVDRISASAERLSELVEGNGAQIESISTVSSNALQNMDKLRSELPVIGASARDVANNIGTAGRTASEQLDHMVAGFERLNEFGQASERQVEALHVRLSDALQRLSGEAGRLDQFAERFDAALAERQQTQLARADELAERGEALGARLDELAGEVDRVAALGREAGDGLGDALARLSATVGESRVALGETDAAMASLTDASVRLLELIRAGETHSREALPRAIEAAEQRLAGLDEQTRALGDLLAQAAERGESLSGHVASAREGGSAAIADIESLQVRLAEHGRAHAEQLETMRAGLAEIDAQSDELAAKAREELGAAIAALEEATRNALGTLQHEQAETISALAERIGSESAEAIGKAVRERSDEAIGEIAEAAERAGGAGRDAAAALRDQLARVNELTANLERRVAQARERAEEQVDNDFARRMALITESLNSHAIDIAKAFSAEVTDTAWASYLRGDRGIFTRRAVRLLDAPDNRGIAALYAEDGEFRDHVNRFIHDFEAMLRGLLSTRDGNALGVTMLSSDTGKLYVALAQAIHRLRD